eukprot:3508430-Alexandrium_andersonii.AAC.1
METIYTAPQPPPNQHPIWRAPGCSLFSITIDEMHTEDLGVVLEYLGSVLWTLVYDGQLQGTADQRLELIWDRVRTLYREKGIRTRLSNL